MVTRIAINGFGRIGRLTFRNLMARPDEFEVVAVNDLTDNQMLATLLKYDSVHGRYDGTVGYDDKHLIVNGKKILALAEKDPAKLPWGENNVDIVIESTGFFTGRSKDGKPGYDSHLAAGCKRVVLSAPAKDGADLTCVLGVNDDKLTKDLKCISNASCTTNCLAPIAKVLNETFGIESGLMTTVHAVGLVIPELKGKLTGIAMRVPVATGSVVDLTVNLKKETTVAEINAAMKAAAEGSLKGILCYTEDPIVSSDIIDDPHSSIFAADFTQVLGDKGKLVKVVSWYDNEGGYSCRTADLCARLAKFL